MQKYNSKIVRYIMVSTDMRGKYIRCNAAHTYTLKGNIMSSIKEMWARLQERLEEDRKVRQTIKELSKLTDYQLRDMGISRGDIYSLASGAYRG